MKKNCYLILCLATLGLTSALCQQAPTPPAAAPGTPPHVNPPAVAPPPGPAFSQRLANIIQQASGQPDAAPALTKFNLDFHGGTPQDLVAAIEKAMGRPVNAIVPDDLADWKLPALKMNNVDVSQLFAALSLATRKNELYPSGYGYQAMSTSCGFRTDGKPSDDAIWYFYVERPVITPATKVCRFYSLAPFLDNGATVDDITTAVQTGWKMLGDTTPPTISFHKDTKLLIAVGEPSKLETIDAVLKALGSGGGGGGLPGVVPPGRPRPLPKPAEKP